MPFVVPLEHGYQPTGSSVARAQEAPRVASSTFAAVVSLHVVGVFFCARTGKVRQKGEGRGKNYQFTRKCRAAPHSVGWVGWLVWPPSLSKLRSKRETIISTDGLDGPVVFEKLVPGFGFLGRPMRQQGNVKGGKGH